MQDVDFSMLTPFVRDALVPVCARVLPLMVSAPKDDLDSIAYLPKVIAVGRGGEITVPDRVMLTLRRMEYGASGIPRIPLLSTIISAVVTHAEQLLAAAIGGGAASPLQITIAI